MKDSCVLTKFTVMVRKMKIASLSLAMTGLGKIFKYPRIVWDNRLSQKDKNTEFKWIHQHKEALLRHI